MTNLLEYLADDDVPEDKPSSIYYDSTFHIEIKQHTLESMLAKSIGVVPQKFDKPILTNFRLEANSGLVRVTGSRGDVSVISSTDAAKIHVEGSAIFPAQKLYEIVKSSDSGDVDIDVRNGEAEITTGSTSWSIKLYNSSNYPRMVDVDSLHFHSVDKNEFVEAIKSVKYAVSTDVYKASMSVIVVDKGKVLACDGNRFQQIILGESFPPLSFLIPYTAIDYLVKFLGHSEEDLEIAESDKHLIFRVENGVFIASKSASKIQNIEKVLLYPAMANKDELLVNKQDLVEAVKRVRINSDIKTNAIILHINEGVMTIESSDSRGNEAREHIDIVWSKKARKISINHKYLLQMLDVYTGKVCFFYLGEDAKTRKSPLLLKDKDTGNIGLLQQMTI